MEIIFIVRWTTFEKKNFPLKKNFLKKKIEKIRKFWNREPNCGPIGGLHPHSLLNPDYVKQLSYQEMKKAAQLEEDKRVTNIIQNDLLLEEKRQKRIREEREFQKKRLMAFMGPDSEEKNWKQW